MSNSATRRINNHKDFQKELHFIEEISALSQCKVEIVDSLNKEAFLSKKEEAFEIELNARVTERDEKNIELSFILDNQKYSMERLGSSSRQVQVKVDRKVGFQTIFEINTFESEGFYSFGKFKCFFITDRTKIKTFHEQFETVTHSRNDTEYFYDCLRVKVNGKRYDVTQLKCNKHGYYVFECLEEQGFDTFSEVCFSIRQAIGFINRLFVGGQMFVFDQSRNFHYSNYGRPEIEGMYSPVTINPFSYVYNEDEVAKSYLERLNRVSLDSLSNLVQRIHDKPEFSVAILVILEVSSTRSLLVIPSSFATIIELLSKHIRVEQEGSFKPIPNAKQAKTIIHELHNVIDGYGEAIDDESILKLKRRLNEINKPVNRRHFTNNEKLIAPFEQLGIKLTLLDIKIIEHRNDLLHGNILLESEENGENEDLYVNYVSAKLFTLISKLILKSIGYHGYVINHAKYLEKDINLQTSEEYFESI